MVNPGIATEAAICHANASTAPITLPVFFPRKKTSKDKLEEKKYFCNYNTFVKGISSTVSGGNGICQRNGSIETFVCHVCSLCSESFSNFICIATISEKTVTINIIFLFRFLVAHFPFLFS